MRSKEGWKTRPEDDEAGARQARLTKQTILDSQTNESESRSGL